MARGRESTGLPTPEPKLKRGIGVVATALAGATALALTAVARDGSGGDAPGREGSVVVDESGSETTFDEAAVRHYSVTYRVEAEPGSPVHDEDLAVARPWRSVERARGAELTSDFGVLTNRPANGEASAFVTTPALAAGDARPDIAVADAVEAGLAELGERRRVLGSECQVYRTEFPLDAGPITPPGDTRTETCVDRRGLVLEERLVVDGWQVARRVAVDVDAGDGGAASTEDSDQTAVPPLPIDEGGAGLREIDPREYADLARWELTAPEGFSLYGHYATVHPSRDTTDDPRAAVSRFSSVLTVWTRGADVVIFETGATLDGTPVQELPGSRSVGAWPTAPGESGPGAARMVVSARGNELRHTEGGRLVRLMATVPTARLAVLAEGITLTDGAL